MERVKISVGVGGPRVALTWPVVGTGSSFSHSNYVCMYSSRRGVISRKSEPAEQRFGTSRKRAPSFRVYLPGPIVSRAGQPSPLSLSFVPRISFRVGFIFEKGCLVETNEKKKVPRT